MIEVAWWVLYQYVSRAAAVRHLGGCTLRNCRATAHYAGQKRSPRTGPGRSEVGSGIYGHLQGNGSLTGKIDSISEVHLIIDNNH